MDEKYFQDLKESFFNLFQKVKTKEEIEALRVSFLGKKGSITEALQKLAVLSLEEKKVLGSKIHALKQEVTYALSEKLKEFSDSLKNQKLQNESIDITLQGVPFHKGVLHPISKTLQRMYSIFTALGFKTVFGSEIESEYYNFDALNMGTYHPARTQADTFFINKEKQFILRTQTSGIQIRTMEKEKLPLAIISPGVCFRKDEIDATHLPLFHQIEGLFIDKNVSFADLKGVLTLFAKEFFGSQTKVRFRPDFFPFTEPSAEVAFSCPVCHAKNSHCSTCHGTGYIEVAGCGLVHPNVLKNGGVDPQEYSGYAFGFGIERLTMIYYGIPDIRLLYENTPEFLTQFSSPLF
jgi:phenylalanyl-tRNA synthetase alpha chain